jgi:methyl-accepting chemotaxis protein
VINKFTVKTRLFLLVALMSVIMLALTGLNLNALDQTNQSLHSVYADRTVPLADLSEIKTLALHMRTATVSSLAFPHEASEQIKKVEQDMIDIDKLWSKYILTYLTPEEKILVDKFAVDKQLFFANVKIVLELLRTSKTEEAGKFYYGDVRSSYLPVSKGIVQLVQLQIDVAKQEYDVAENRYHTTLQISTTALTLGLLLSIVISFLIISNLLNKLGGEPDYAAHIATEISSGNLLSSVVVRDKDKSSLLFAMKQMQQQILERVTTTNNLVNEMTRIKVALDNVSTGVMIADSNRTIVYANKSVISILGKAETDIRKHLPNFSTAKLIGTNIDSFHAKPQHQAQLLGTLNSTYTASMGLSGHAMVVTASPVINESGERLGSVAEWLDRSVEVVVENEVEAIVEAAARGDFTHRVNTEGKEGFFRLLSASLNQLMQTSETSLNEVVRVLEALASGDLTEKITNDYSGTFGRLKDDANASVEKLKEIISIIKEASDNINTGAKEIASGNNDLSHRTEEQAASLEQTAASMEELTSTVQHNAENAKQANQLAIDASDIAGKGVAVVNQVVQTMEDINASSRKIGDIISVIDDIAFQTNILALNAAVEAARAGDQGRGFAVVAIEVRNLAQRAATAAGEIKHLISDSVEKVSDGTKLVTQAGLTMNDIVSSIHGVTVMMSEISGASAEQTAGIQQVNQAISQMDDVTQQNAALVEQAAAAAESLEEQAQNLSGTMAQFKVDGYTHTSYGGGNQAKSASSFPTPQHKESSLVKAVTTYKAAKSTPIAPSASDEWEEF